MKPSIKSKNWVYINYIFALFCRNELKLLYQSMRIYNTRILMAKELLALSSRTCCWRNRHYKAIFFALPRRSKYVICLDLHGMIQFYIYEINTHSKWSTIASWIKYVLRYIHETVKSLQFRPDNYSYLDTFYAC